MTVSTQASATARRWRKQYRPIAANTNNSSRQTSRPPDLAAQQRSYQVLCDRAAGPTPRISTADTTSADAALLIGDQNAYAPSVDQFWASSCRVPPHCTEGDLIMYMGGDPQIEVLRARSAQYRWARLFATSCGSRRVTESGACQQ